MVRALDCQDESCDLSNGVKYGQSTVYDSSQYSEDIIMRFRKMATGSSGDSEFDMNSGEYTSSSVEYSGQQRASDKGDSSSETESRAFNANRRNTEQEKIRGNTQSSSKS